MHPYVTQLLATERIRDWEREASLRRLARLARRSRRFSSTGGDPPAPRFRRRPAAGEAADWSPSTAGTIRRSGAPVAAIRPPAGEAKGGPAEAGHTADGFAPREAGPRRGAGTRVHRDPPGEWRPSQALTRTRG